MRCGRAPTSCRPASAATVPAPAELIRRLGIVEATYVWQALQDDKPDDAGSPSEERAPRRPVGIAGPRRSGPATGFGTALCSLSRSAGGGRSRLRA
jgi:hypothetical protein